MFGCSKRLGSLGTMIEHLKDHRGSSDDDGEDDEDDAGSGAGAGSSGGDGSNGSGEDALLETLAARFSLLSTQPPIHFQDIPVVEIDLARDVISLAKRVNTALANRVTYLSEEWSISKFECGGCAESFPSLPERFDHEAACHSLKDTERRRDTVALAMTSSTRKSYSSRSLQS